MSFWYRNRFAVRKKKLAPDPLFPTIAKKKGEDVKYNSKKVTIDGIKFASGLEGAFYEFLRDDPRVEILELQPKYLLQDKYQTKDGRKIAKIEYVADFFISVEGDLYIVDAKGAITKEFAIKRKIFERRYPDEILVVCSKISELRQTIF